MAKDILYPEELRMKNIDLLVRYEEMHKRGKAAWFDDGEIERELILSVGEPWEGRKVLEIGCGEGDLCRMIACHKPSLIVGVDYSAEAIKTANMKYPPEDSIGAPTIFICDSYRKISDTQDIVVMQGVLEHLDDPFNELKWMIDHFKPKTVITSSPGFINPRGIVWMTLYMLGAVMSKTDLHHINPWDMEKFCHANGYELTSISCDKDWSFGQKMILDLKQRIPLALRDGAIPYSEKSLESFLDWLEKAGELMRCGESSGATICYRIDT